MNQPVCVAPVGDRCGEGAVWIAEERAVYWTDITRFLVQRYDADTGGVRFWQFDEPVVAVMATNRLGTLLLALGSRTLLWRPESDTRTDHGFALPGWPQARLNECRPDPRGEAWLGSMGNNVMPNGDDGEVAPHLGRLYRLARDGQPTELLRDIGIANTLCWSPDRKRFHTADTLANAIDVWDYDMADGGISNRRPFFAGHPRGAPDGSSMDSAGRLWNCRYGGGCILVVDPAGTLERVVELPVPNVTTCTFGGPDLCTLYITTAGRPSAPGDRLAGGLFALEVEVPGQHENRVKLG